MTELDAHREIGRSRNDLAVAERPVRTATGARPARTHVGTENDHGHAKREIEQGEGLVTLPVPQVNQGCLLRG